MSVRYHKVEQKTPEWLQLRSAIPTASRFKQIVYRNMRKKGHPLEVSKSCLPGGAYYTKLLAEWVLGGPMVAVTSQVMERGNEGEEDAFADYFFTRDKRLHDCGFISDDGVTYGYSPDGVVGESAEDGGLWECKTPMLPGHVANMLDPEAFAAEHVHQCQGGLWVSKRQWVDLESWHPTLPKVIVRVKPDKEWQSTLDREVPAFLARLAAGRAKLREMGIDK